LIRQDAGPQFQEKGRSFCIGEVRVLVDHARFVAKPHDTDDPLDAT
jgi:hypothetical protein